MLVHAVGKEIPPFQMPARFRTDIAYFMTPGDEAGIPTLGPNEYWVRLVDSKRWLEELVVLVISPLNAEIQAEVELTEDQEAWLEWMVKNEVEQVRIES